MQMEAAEFTPSGDAKIDETILNAAYPEAKKLAHSFLIQAYRHVGRG